MPIEDEDRIPEPKDRADELADEHSWDSDVDRLAAESMARHTTLEVLAAVAEHKLIDFGEIGHPDECTCGFVFDGDTTWAQHIQSLTINSTSLEKFAEGAHFNRDREWCNAVAEVCGGMGYTEGQDEIEQAKKYIRTYGEDEQDELRQPIEDKSICPVGHMKANLVKFDLRNPDLAKEFRPQHEVWAYCLACQEQKELREALENLVKKIETTKEPLDAACTIAAIHGQPYTGPNWGEEIESARQALERKDHKENHDAEDDIPINP